MCAAHGRLTDDPGVPVVVHPVFDLAVCFAFGACVGSFLNVVILRTPEGRSVWHPPSHDPATGKKLAWWENIPLLSYALLRGKSRHTGEHISWQYPLVEAVTALMFVGLYAFWFFTPYRPVLDTLGFWGGWSVYASAVVLLSALLAATVIDIRSMIIPIQIPWTAAVVCGVLLTVGAALDMPSRHLLYPTSSEPLLPWGDWTMFGAGAGGVAGMIAAALLLRLGVLPQSFSDEQVMFDAMPEEKKNDPEAFLEYPHPRREMVKECLFAGVVLLGSLGGYLIAVHGAGGWPAIPAWASTAGACAAGLVVAAGLVWAARILGTLALGKEAMGLGDVHLMAGIGVVVGPLDAVLVFFLAPFLGLAGTVLTAGVAAMTSGRVRAVPYGPYLAAAATLVVVLGRDRIDLFDIFP
ncbi:MAG: prepilin peptidase [Planctomycetota bacterium]